MDLFQLKASMSNEKSVYLTDIDSNVYCIVFMRYIS